MLEILGQLVGGTAVSYVPGDDDAYASVRLRDVAQDMMRAGQIPTMGARALEALDHLHEDENGRITIASNAPTHVGGWWKRFKRKTKKAFGKVAKFGKKIAHNKLVRQLIDTAATYVPPPYNIAFEAASGAIRLGLAVEKGVHKAKEMLGYVEGAAKGDVSVPELEAKARELNIGPNLALSAATISRFQQMANKGDVQAKKALDLARHIVLAAAHGSRRGVKEAATAVKALQIKAQFPGSSALTVKGAAGTYHVFVVPA